MLDHTAPAPGETVLDLGAGPGGAGLRAARLVTPGGAVLLSDVSPAMIDAARTRAERLGLQNVSAEVADATALPQPDGHADVVLCRFALQAMPDPAAVLAQALRVLAPGGRLALAVFAASERNAWASLSMQVLHEAGGDPASAPGKPGIFALADEQRLRSMLIATGFAQPRLEHLTDERRYASFESWWALRRSLPPGARRAWSALDDATADQVVRLLRERVKPYERDGALVFPSDVLVASARKPRP